MNTLESRKAGMATTTSKKSMPKIVNQYFSPITGDCKHLTTEWLFYSLGYYRIFSRSHNFIPGDQISNAEKIYKIKERLLYETRLHDEVDMF